MSGLDRAWGIARSLAIYHGIPGRQRRLRRLYAQFVTPGALAFDIGAHAGNRTRALRALGARVVALEPQPGPARVIALMHGHDRDVTLVRAAASDRSGTLTLRVNTRNPTVSTASSEFIAAADGAGGWEGQRWDRAIEVPAVTLDDLVAAHGRPAFVKIDVEGFEDRVLAGLSTALPALSFEFRTIQRDVAMRCLDRLAALGPYRFDYAEGESQRLVLGR